MALTATQVVLPHPPNLSRVETHRVIAVLDKAVERLHLLAMLDEQRAAPNGATLASTAGGATAGGSYSAPPEDPSNRGVGTILEEQKQLETRYEQLIAATQRKRHNPMDPLLDPACFSHVRNVAEEGQLQELRDVSKRLKEQSRLLCRQLKDNPNDAENWKKIVGERAEVCMQLNACVSELHSTGQANDIHDVAVHGTHQQGSYEQFAKKVLEEQVAAQWAEQLVKLEKETNQNVKQLQNEVKLERALKEQELEKRHKVIAELKTELRVLKQSVKSRMDRLRAETEASTEAQKRKALDDQRVINDRLKELELKVTNEESVTAAMTAHIEGKANNIDASTDEWSQKHAREQRTIEGSKHDKQTERNSLGSELAEAKTRLEHEEYAFKAREADKKREQDSRQTEESIANAKYAAATKLQAGIKGFFTRSALVVLKKKAGKKKKAA